MAASASDWWPDPAAAATVASALPPPTSAIVSTSTPARGPAEPIASAIRAAQASRSAIRTAASLSAAAAAAPSMSSRGSAVFATSTPRSFSSMTEPSAAMAAVRTAGSACSTNGSTAPAAVVIRRSPTRPITNGNDPASLPASRATITSLTPSAGMVAIACRTAVSTAGPSPAAISSSPAAADASPQRPMARIAASRTAASSPRVAARIVFWTAALAPVAFRSASRSIRSGRRPRPASDAADDVNASSSARSTSEARAGSRSGPTASSRAVNRPMLKSRCGADFRRSTSSGMPSRPCARIAARVASARRCSETSAARTA